MTAGLHVDADAVRALRDHADPCSRAALRNLLPEGAKLLASYSSADAGFLAGQFSAGGSVKSQRSIIHVKAAATTLILDWVIPGVNYGPWQWTHDAVDGLESVVLRSDPWLLAFRPKDAAAPRLIPEVDLIGIALPDWYVWFHRDVVSAQSAISFLLPPGAETNFLLAGMAPGAWDVWLDGWVQETPMRVSPEQGAAYWRGKPGSYFFRRQVRS